MGKEIEKKDEKISKNEGNKKEEKRQIYKKIVKQRQEWKVNETEKQKNLTQRI